MLYPSIDHLMEKIPSKYLLVTITAKRAREMLDTKDFLKDEKEYKSVKYVGKALEEVLAGLLTADEGTKKIRPEDELQNL